MLELRAITKRFGEVLANDHIDIRVEPGTIHAIVGENGAGKSTAMRIAYGFYTADSGEILVDGEPRQIQTPHDAEEFFAILRRMREQGKTVIIITHKLSEVLAISDDVTVMRDGRVVGRVKTAETSAAELARMMVGRDVLLRVEKPNARPGETILSVRNLSVAAGSGSGV